MSESRPVPSIPDHELLTVIGEGGAGKVWLAKSLSGAYRAVKAVYRQQPEGDPEAFRCEFEALQQVEEISRSSEELISILHLGINAGEGYFYYVMELADSQGGEPVEAFESYSPRTLQSELKDSRRLSFQECCEVARSLAAALKRLHEKGLVHRDIKPSNVVYHGGLPKLADFGLVTSIEGGGSGVGTLEYIPPEGSGTPMGDVYSLGLVMYQMSTGKVPRRFPEPVTQLQILENWRGLRSFMQIVLRAADQSPERRYPSARELCEALSKLTLDSSRQADLRFRVWRRVLAVLSIVSLGMFLLVMRLDQMRYHERMRFLEAQADRLIHDADPLGASVWIADAIAESESDSVRNTELRIRLGQLFENSAKIVGMWYSGGAINSARKGPFGRHLVAADAEEGILVWDALQPVDEPPHQLGPSGEVEQLFFRSDGSALIAAGLGDKVAKIWQVDHSNPSLGDRFLPEVELEHPEGVYHASFSPDGTQVLTACRDGKARIWSGSPMRMVRQFGGDQPMRVASFRPDGKRIVTGSDDGLVSVWDAVMEQGPLQELRHGAGPIYDASYSPDGSFLVSAGYDRQAILWDGESGALIRSLPHTGPVYGASFRGDGRLIVTTDGTRARVWRIEDRLVTEWNVLNHSGTVLDAGFTPDGSVLTADSDGVLRLWHVDGVKDGPSLFGRGTLDRSQVAMAPNREQGVLLITPPDDVETTLRVITPPWSSVDVASVGEPSLVLPGKQRNPRVNPVNADLVVTTHEATVQFCDLKDGQMLHQIEVRDPQGGGIRRIHYNSSGSQLATVSGTNVFVFDVASGEKALSLAHTNAPFLIDRAIFSPVREQLATVAAPRGPVLDFFPNVYLWNTTNGVLEHVFAHDADVVHAAFSPDGTRLATACRDDSLRPFSVRLWDTTNGNLLFSLPHRDGVRFVAFDAVGRRLATACEDGSARIWDVDTGLPVTPYIRHPHQVSYVGFSQNGQWLITACYDQKVRAWKAATGMPFLPPIPCPWVVRRSDFVFRDSVLLIEGWNSNLREVQTGAVSLVADDRPVEQLRNVVRLLASRRTNSNDVLVPMSKAELKKAWEDLRR